MILSLSLTPPMSTNNPLLSLTLSTPSLKLVMVRKKPGNNLIRDEQSLLGRSDATQSIISSDYLDDAMETSSDDYHPTAQTKAPKSRITSPLPQVYRRRATPISDSDFEQPDYLVVPLPSKKNQLLLMQKFQPSKHATRQATPATDDEIVLDLSDPFYNRSMSPGVGLSAITVNDIFTPSPVESARLLSPFAGDRSVSPSASLLGKGKSKSYR